MFIDTAPPASGNHGGEDFDTLALSNTEAATGVVCVTVLHAFDAAGQSTFKATLTKEADGLLLALTRDGMPTLLSLKPGQSDSATPIARLLY